MPDYISKFTGQEIDDYLQKSKDINKTAGQINNALDFVDKTNEKVTNAEIGEVMAKASDGSLEGTGIINEANKIFFPKDGRFPSGSIDVGPAITISENGGWVQNTSDTLGKTYLMLDYEIDKTGTKRPIYWERATEEKNVIINSANQTTMSDVSTFTHIPSANSQVNALYMNFALPVSNLRIEIVSLITNQPIKYIPNENSWKNNIGGLNLSQGINDILQNGSITPMSLLTSYSLKFNLKADDPINIMGDGIHPYIAVDRQLITAKGVLLQGEGTGSADSPEQIRDKLGTLIGDARLDATHIKNIPSGSSETGETIKIKLEALTGDERLSANAIKDLPSGGGDTAIDIKEKLETLTGADKLSATAIKDIVDVINRIDGGNANAVFTDTMNGGAA